MYVFWYDFIYFYSYLLYSGLLAIGIMSRVFANGSGNRGLIPGRVIQKTPKMVVGAALLSTQHYKGRVKSRAIQVIE